VHRPSAPARVPHANAHGNPKLLDLERLAPLLFLALQLLTENALLQARDAQFILHRIEFGLQVDLQGLDAGCRCRSHLPELDAQSLRLCICCDQL
jgi:hypothetical protein